MLDLKIWRLHPNGCRITENSSFGWNLFAPTDLDFIWKGGKYFEYFHHETYNDFDYHFLRNLASSYTSQIQRWLTVGGRKKFDFGTEDGTIKIWSGCAFQTPKNWCLQIRNTSKSSPYFNIAETIIDSDKTIKDIWIQIDVRKANTWVHLRKEGLPLASIVPVHRDTLHWSSQESVFNVDNKESKEAFQSWLSYNDLHTN